MALVPFAKAADLVALEPSLDEAAAELALDLVSGAIRASVGWDVDKVVDADHTVLIPRHQRSLGPTQQIWTVVLPTTQLTAVSAVEVDGTAQDAADYDWTTAGIVYLGNPASEKVVVTYTAGYVRAPADQAPGVFRTVAVEYALRMGNNPSGVRSYQLGNAQETFDYSALKVELDEDCRLDPHRANLL